MSRIVYPVVGCQKEKVLAGFLHYDLVVSGEDLDDQSCILLIAETSQDLRINRQLDSPPSQVLAFGIQSFIFEGLV